MPMYQKRTLLLSALRCLLSNCIRLYRCRERREHHIFRALLNTVPGLEERIMTGSEDEVTIVAELVRTFYLTF
jgi:hypothetical protein